MSKILIVEGPKGAGKTTFINNYVKDFNGSYVVLKRHMVTPTSSIYMDIINRKVMFSYMKMYYKVIDSNASENDLNDPYWNPDLIIFDRFFLSHYFVTNIMNPHDKWSEYINYLDNDKMTKFEVNYLTNRVNELYDVEMKILGTNFTKDELIKHINQRSERNLSDDEELSIEESIKFFKRYNQKLDYEDLFLDEVIENRSDKFPYSIIHQENTNAIGLLKQIKKVKNQHTVTILVGGENFWNDSYIKSNMVNDEYHTYVHAKTDQDAWNYLNDPMFQYHEKGVTNKEM